MSQWRERYWRRESGGTTDLDEVVSDGFPRERRGQWGRGKAS